MQDSFAGNTATHAPVAQARFKPPPASASRCRLQMSFPRFLNDMIQSLIVAIHSMFKGQFLPGFIAIGASASTFRICARVLEPAAGIYTDKSPQPCSSILGLGSGLIDLMALAFARPSSSAKA